MRKNDQKSTNSPDNKRKAESPKQKAEDEQKADNELKAESSKQKDELKAESSKPKAEDELKAESPKQKAVRKATKSDITHSKSKIQNKSEIEHPKSEIKNKSEIEIPKSEINNMEVHHHPQLEHNPKPWKEYLLEGFMIFIAVMMGFIAENVREDITNSEHARQLTTQLVQDLKADTAQLNHVYKEETEIINSNDSLFKLLQQPLEKADTRRIQKSIADSHSLWPFHPSAVAIAAIKNELHLKQFSNSEIISYFARYDKHMELLHTVQDINLQYQRTYFDGFITAHFTPANLDAAFHDFSKLTPKMRNLTQSDLDQLATDLVLIRINNKELVDDNRVLKDDATKLLQYVTKQYHLAGE